MEIEPKENKCCALALVIIYIVGSFCSSFGYYGVGKEKTMSKLKGRKALLLYGKDKTNSNALQRGILYSSIL